MYYEPAKKCRVGESILFGRIPSIAPCTVNWEKSLNVLTGYFGPQDMQGMHGDTIPDSGAVPHGRAIKVQGRWNSPEGRVVRGRGP